MRERISNCCYGAMLYLVKAIVVERWATLQSWNTKNIDEISAHWFSCLKRHNIQKTKL